MMYAGFEHFRGTFVENAVFLDAMNFILEDAPKLEDGKYDLPDDMFAIIKHYAPHPGGKSRRYETHLKYLDLQVVLDGEKYLLYHPLDDSMPVIEDQLDTNDVRFHADPTKGREVALLLRPGVFCLLGPHDAHKTECKAGAEHARKCVVKIPVGMLKF